MYYIQYIPPHPSVITICPACIPEQSSETGMVRFRRHKPQKCLKPQTGCPTMVFVGPYSFIIPPNPNLDKAREALYEADRVPDDGSHTQNPKPCTLNPKTLNPKP